MRNPFISNRSRPVLVACALIASALLGSSPPSQAAESVCRPWHLDLSAQMTNPVYDENDILIYQDAAGSGRASHMGAIDAVGMDYFYPPEDGKLMVDGDGIFTAPNGDQIFVNFDGSVIDLETGEGVGTYVVTGGTGRFANATGTADFASSFLAPNGFDLIADGELCF